MRGLTLGDECCKKISAAVCENKTLISINLSRNDLTHDSISTLSNSLKQHKLVELDLSHNNIGDLGIR